MCTATDSDTRNLRADRPPDHEPEEVIQSHIDDTINEEDDARARIPIVHPEGLVGHTFGNTQ